MVRYYFALIVVAALLSPAVAGCSSTEGKAACLAARVACKLVDGLCGGGGTSGGDAAE